MSDFHRSMRKKAEERVEMLEKKLAALVKDREAGFAVVETLNSEVNRLTEENSALRSLLREARVCLSDWKIQTYDLRQRIDAALGDK